MKKLKQSRVSWPPDRMLCQVKLFLSEDCPAKVASQPRSMENLKQSLRKPQAPDLPPGFEGNNHYTIMQELSDIPQINWRRPSKFILRDNWMVGAGDESTEKQTENLRIGKVLEAMYPHPSVIPSCPSVSPDVETKCYDDSKTPIIRLTPIEDEQEAAEKSSYTSLGSNICLNTQSQYEPRPDPATVSGPGESMGLAASAVLTALMKAKDQRSTIDPDLLVEFLRDPKTVLNLIKGTTSSPVDTDITPRVAHPNPSAIDRIPLKQTSTSQPYAYHVMMSVQPSTSVATELPQVAPNTHPLNPTNPGLKQPPKPGFDTYSQNINQVEVSGELKSDAPPVKNLDYFKNLIRKHGTDTQTASETNPYNNESGKYQGRVDSVNVKGKKIQKPCMYFGTRRGCKLGETCMYLHDWSSRRWTDVPEDAPRGKRKRFRA